MSGRNTKFVTGKGIFERQGLADVGRFVLPAKPAEIKGTMLKHRASVRWAWVIGSFAIAEWGMLQEGRFG